MYVGLQGFQKQHFLPSLMLGERVLRRSQDITVVGHVYDAAKAFSNHTGWYWFVLHRSIIAEISEVAVAHV